MSYRIHFEYADGTTDSVVLNGATINEVRDAARAEVARRNPVNYWSEEI